MDKILEKIESDKEILSTLPKNNKKNITKYMEEVKKLETEYQQFQDNILKEIQKRYDKILDVKECEEIEKLEVQIKEIETMLDTIDDIKTSYEKMGMDRKIYKLGRYYKENLESINEEILSCINKFKEVGIELTPDEFNYSIYVEDYMKVFFEEIKKNNVNSDIIKNKFEEIYWKCPDIIIHIELNLRYIFLKKQSTIDKYFEKRKNDLLNTIKMKPEQIKEKYMELNKELSQKIFIDKASIVNNFLDGKYSTKDYTDDKIKTYYETMINQKALKKENKEELDENIIKFINSLYEYKNYTKFQFIIDDIKKKYTEKEQHKNEYNSIKKEIINKEKKLQGLNKKISGKGLFGKKKEKSEKQNTEYNKLILEIKESYRKLDAAEIYSKIIERLSDNSTIYDVLMIASGFKNYLVDCIIENNPSIEPKEIELYIRDLLQFLRNPYNTIIKNIGIMEEKDIPIIISDRYKLLNFNINKEDINIDNIDNIIDILNKIETRHNMDLNGIKIDDMEFIVESKKILGKK